jgi:CHAD domain-containing protein
VKRRGHDLAGIAPEARHEVRIEAKKLRYASEFFSGLVEGRTERKRLKAFLSGLEDLQEALGDLNDLETAKALHAAQAGAGSEQALPAEGDDEREGELLERAAAAHQSFAEAKRFWRDFR